VRLLTMHKAKGLEFPVVVLADLAGKSSDSGARLVGRAGTYELRFAGCRTAGFDAATAEQDKRDEAEEIRLLYVGATRARERLVIPWFKEKGERLDLLRRGFEPVASGMVELDFGGPRAVVAAVPDGKRPDVAELIARRQAWQTEHAALLARVAQPVARVSPSKLGGDAETREEEPTGVVRTEAMEFGVLVHAALERMDATGLPDKARVMVERALQSELMKRVARADEAHREVPFAIMTADGLMEGKIDLLFREGSRWMLVDYKTDARVEPEKYRSQMAAYAAALEQAAGIKIAETLLFYVAAGKVVALP
jgi:ATP-dependent helicase/nuclease subunit A